MPSYTEFISADEQAAMEVKRKRRQIDCGIPAANRCAGYAG
jgi:hypothetical protein